jgi:ABC-type multidrug transport system ATPase subunit
MKIEATSVTKAYHERLIFRDVSFTVSRPESLCIKGPNGCGKSTMMRILARQVLPTKGSVMYYNGGIELDEDAIIHTIGFMSPHVEPYGELTPKENMRFISRTGMPDYRFDELLHEFGLIDHADMPAGELSTGLKQRLKFLLAVLNDPPVLFFDEPGSNLDTPGKDLVYGKISEMMGDRIVVMATNVIEEERMCGGVIALAK